MSRLHSSIHAPNAVCVSYDPKILELLSRMWTSPTPHDVEAELERKERERKAREVDLFWRRLRDDS